MGFLNIRGMIFLHPSIEFMKREKVRLMDVKEPVAKR